MCRLRLERNKFRPGGGIPEGDLGLVIPLFLRGGILVPLRLERNKFALRNPPSLAMQRNSIGGEGV